MINMVSLHLMLAAVILKVVYALDASCFNRLCTGPKYDQSDCCKGFICVALYKPGAEDVLECVDEDEHFRVKSEEEILQEVDREFEKSIMTNQDYDETLLLDDTTLNSYIERLHQLEESLYNMEGFNSPVVVEVRQNNITI